MVFDWFRRNPEPPPAAVTSSPPVSAPAPEPPPTAADQVPSPEPPHREMTGAEQAAPAGAGTEPETQDALEWARQAYARLKAQQQAAVQGSTATVPEAPLSEQATEADVASRAPEPAQAQDAGAGLSLLEQAAAQRAERRQALVAPTSEPPPAVPPPPGQGDGAEPSLGAFDDTFTWSAEVLAAQGRRLAQVSLEEIDWLGRLRQGLEKTRRGFVTQLLENLGDDPLTAEVVDDLESTLLRADVGVSATDQVLDALRRRLNQEVVEPAEGIRFLKEQLRGVLEAPITRTGEPLLAPRKGHLNVWLLVGVNGVGKTTTLGKLANLAVRSGYSCLIAAADTFRAAAVQQVQVWGERSGVPVIANPTANADPAAVVFDAIGAARSQGTELVLVDTAGRLQTKHNLMEELAKVRRIVDRLAPEARVESLLVLDASQGQNGLRQAMAFAGAAGLTGVVITKLDGSSRGGVALAVASEAGLPIRFIGAGEGLRDLRPFNSFEFVEALLAG